MFTKTIKTSVLLLLTATALNINPEAVEKRNIFHKIGDSLDTTGEWIHHKGDQARDAAGNAWKGLNKWGNHNEEVAKKTLSKMNAWGNHNEEVARNTISKMNAWGKHNEQVTRKAVNKTVTIVTKKIWPALTKFGRDFATGVKKIYKGQFRCNRVELPICLGIDVLLLAALCPAAMGGMTLLCVVALINGEECFRRNCHLDVGTLIPFGEHGEPIDGGSVLRGSGLKGISEGLRGSRISGSEGANPLVIKTIGNDGKELFCATDSSTFSYE